MTDSAASDVRIWSCDMDAIQVDDAYIGFVLTAVECERGERFKSDVLRRRYRIGRAATRKILGEWLGEKPNKLDIRVTEQGKPFIPEGPMFNVSHSERYLMIGVCADMELGVDIETVKPIDDFQSVARRQFSDRERDALAALPEEDRLCGFYRLWTRKEAVAKALGKGLAMDFTSFSVSLAESSQCESIEISATFPSDRACFVRPCSLFGEAESAIASTGSFRIAQQFHLGDHLNWVEGT